MVEARAPLEIRTYRVCCVFHPTFCILASVILLMLSMMDEGKNVWHSERVVDVLATPLLPQATFGRILIYSLLFCLLPVTLNKIKNTVTRTFTQPPSVKYGYPFVGNILSYSQDPVTYLRKATAQFGRIFEVKMILTNTIWLRGNDLNKVYLDAKEVGCSI